MPAAQELADERLHARIDVGTVERRDARLGERHHVGDGMRTIHAAMPAGQLPAALDETRHHVAGGELARGDRWMRHVAHDSPSGGSGTSVTSA